MEVTMTHDDRYSAAIRAAIAARDTTQTETATKAGLSLPAWNRRMHGDTSWRMNEVEAIARALDMTLDALIGSGQ
jgi:hypothetical protein